MAELRLALLIFAALASFIVAVTLLPLHKQPSATASAERTAASRTA